MLRRHLCLVRAWSAAGLLTTSLLGIATTASAADRGNEGVATRSVAQTDTISILDAKKTGVIAVNARGAGQYQVKLSLKNTTDRRLNVVIPPGLVASSAASQGRGGGFQSMGLGAVRNQPGGFGEFRGSHLNQPGFRSIGINPEASHTIAIPSGATVDLPMPSVCLNYGIPTPTARDSFEIVAVEDYTKDTRVHKALKSLIALGTSQGVAQAAMWRVCNDVSFATMAKEPKKVLNAYEIALAAKFVDALDASGSSELVDPAYLSEGRVFVQIHGDDALITEADRLSNAIEGQKVLGLPARAFLAENEPKVAAPALLFDVALIANKKGETQAKVVMKLMTEDGKWDAIGKTSLLDHTSLTVIDGERLAKTISRTIASTYVTVKAASQGKGVTTFKLENRLPFTIGAVALKTGQSLGAPVVPFHGLGIAPTRSTAVTVGAPVAIVEDLELNGL